MKKPPWSLIIVDRDRKVYASTGVIADDRHWNDRVAQEQKKGRDMNCYSCDVGRVKELAAWEREEGLTRKSIQEVLTLS